MAELRSCTRAVALAACGALSSGAAACARGHDSVPPQVMNEATQDDAGAANFTNANESACDRAAAERSSIGCNYLLHYPRGYTHRGFGSPWGACYAAFVTSASDVPVELSLTYDGEALDVSKFAYLPSGTGANITYTPLPRGLLPPGEVAILFLAAAWDTNIKCPLGTLPAIAAELSIPSTGFGKSFHLRSSAPIVMHDIYPYGGGGGSFISAATLLLPVSAWGTNYLSVTPQPPSQLSNTQNWITIVAAEENTKVTLTPTVDLPAFPGFPPVPRGTSYTYPMAKGDVLQFLQPQELNGTPISSDKPIGLWGGAECMNIPKDVNACDSAHQQISPVRAFGSEYAAVRPRNRYEDIDETPPWRILAAVDGTTFTYFPEAPPLAPTSLGKGEVAEFRTGTPFVVKSQDDEHPFYMAAYMDGAGQYGPLGDARGDPEFVNVVPPQQYRSSYTFFTDPTYPETHLVVVRMRNAGTFADVWLDCAGVLGGWERVGDYEYTRIDLVRGNFEPQGRCNNGRQQMTSDAPFGVTVWGWGSAATGTYNSQYVSYAYAAGLDVRFINDVVVR